jgi:mono/diheme cytochrome c family protein
MTMRSLLLTILLLVCAVMSPLVSSPLAQQASPQVAGDAARGKALWLETEHVECRECHGVKGEGAFGPDLAGRKLTRAQLIYAVRKPWGAMPAFPATQISDRELIDLMAYFDTLPTVEQPGPWRREVPPGAPRGLAVATTAGCTQCHHPAFNNGRAVMGAVNADFQWFMSMVYAQTSAYPAVQASLGEPPYERMGMGNFNPTRVPESMLREIWTYLMDLGFRPRMRGHLSAGVAAANGVTYTLEVRNTGLKGKGLTAEDLTVGLVVPAGTKVVATTGPGYLGVKRDEQAKADMAIWAVSQMGPGDRQAYTLTLSQAGTAKDNVRGTIRWMKPAVKTAPNDSEVILPAPIANR